MNEEKQEYDSHENNCNCNIDIYAIYNCQSTANNPD
jgi:hypothetical protein